jgi:hypothetical protein
MLGNTLEKFLVNEIEVNCYLCVQEDGRVIATSCTTWMLKSVFDKLVQHFKQINLRSLLNGRVNREKRDTHWSAYVHCFLDEEVKDELFIVNIWDTVQNPLTFKFFDAFKSKWL